MIASTGRVEPEAIRTQRHLQRPSFRWRDLWQAPLNDFPIRDEIVYQYLPLGPDLDVLEIGPGSGLTAFRLSRQVHRMTLADAAEEPIAELRREFEKKPNVRCVCADIGGPNLRALLGERYDVAFGLDVFEYVTDPQTALANLASILRPAGELFLTFPNVPPPKGDGVTYFETSEELERMLHEAGFERWSIFAIRLTPYASRVYRTLHEAPLRMYRRLRSNNPDGKPQTYDRVWFFHNRHSLERYRVELHFAWLVLRTVLRLRGNVFASRRITGNIYGNQLVIRAWK